MESLEWLKRNKPLRMDANVDVFDEERRRFHLQRYRFATEHVRDTDVLDLACGTGYGSAILAETARSVVGVDASLEAVEYARRTYSGPKVRFETGYAELTGLPSRAFGAVVSYETLEHLISPMFGLEEFRRLLTPDGVLVASVPNNWGYTSHHFVDFNAALLQELIGLSFGEARYFYQNSGRKRRFKPVGIGPLTPESSSRCECILVVATHPKPGRVDEDDRVSLLIEELYRCSFDRHRQFLYYDNLFRKLRLHGVGAQVASLLQRLLKRSRLLESQSVR